MSVVYVLTTPMPEDGGDDATVEQIRKRAKWDNDDYVCGGLILNGSHLRIEESLRMQNSDKPKGKNVVGPSVVNMVEHNNSSRYNDNKGKRGKAGNKANGSGTNGSVDGSTNSLKGQNMFNKSFQVYYVTYVSEAYFVQDDDVAWWVESGATVHVCKDRCWLNIVNDYIASAFMSTSKLKNSILWHARLGHVHFKRMHDMSKDGLIPAFDMDTEKCKSCMLNKITKKPFQNVKCETEVLKLIHSDLCDRFCYVYLLHTKDDALDKFKVFKTEIELQQGALIKRFRIDMGVPRPSQRSLVNETEYIGGLVVPEDEEVTDEGFRQKSWIDYFDTYDPVARISIIRLLIALALIHNLIIHQMDVKTTFLYGELDEEIYMNQPQGFIMPGNENKVFSMKDIGEANVILRIRIKHVSNEKEISQSHYIKKVLKKFNYFDCTLVSTPMDTSEKLMPNDSTLVNPNHSALASNSEGIQEANLHHQFNKESEFVALETASKEAEWLRNLIPEIPLSSKPIAPISIRCDSVATLAKAYNQMYNGKYRHAGVMHSMIHELIMNEVVYIDLIPQADRHIQQTDRSEQISSKEIRTEVDEEQIQADIIEIRTEDNLNYNKKDYPHMQDLLASQV
ncbi:zinc finger, CCHC-type containing protein [Tanacetum coccineum]|uniref:Zinc finger, CCHC-type containing protein n=1 Tax=Tanacetum coccineum TaxID=301880 RepID=A0ABQ5DZ55_9ASTR